MLHERVCSTRYVTLTFKAVGASRKKEMKFIVFIFFFHFSGGERSPWTMTVVDE